MNDMKRGNELDLITIVVPVYNVEKYLLRCVKSILIQTYKKTQIILVDDGSTDKSGEMCDELSLKDSRIKVIHKVNGGLSDARNFGILAAKGKYITFIDSDDYISDDYIEYLYKLLKDSNAEISVGGLVRTSRWKDSYRLEKTELVLFNKKQAIEEILYSRKFTTSAPAKLYLTKLFENIQFPIGKISEDLFTIYKVLDKANLIVYGSQIIYYYYFRSGSIVTSKFSKKNLDVVEALFEIKKEISLVDYGIEKAFSAQMIECINGIFICNPRVKEIRELGLWEEYSYNRKTVVLDSNACKRTRMFALLSYGGLPFIKFVISNYYRIKWNRSK